MTKLLNFIGKGLLTLIEWVFILLIFVAFAIRTSPFQTFVAQKATEFLSKEMNTEIKIDEVAIVFIDEVRLDGVLVKDLDGDTLFAGSRIFATLKDFDLKKNYFNISEVDIQDGYAHLKKDTNGVMNMNFLIDYFSSDQPAPKSNQSIFFDIEKVKLTNTTFRFDDFTAPPTGKGMDYAHLNVRNINTEITDISIKDSDIQATIKHLSATEQSGFVLNDFSAIAKVGPSGVYLDNLKINTNKSVIEAQKLNMETNQFADFSSFVDSVMFDANIQLSSVSMQDIGFFAPQLAGMDENLNFSGNVKQNVNNLEISDFELKFKEKTRIRGSFKLPDFKDLDNAYFDETIDYFYVDLKEFETLKMPESVGKKTIQLNNQIDQFIFAEGNKLRLKGKIDDFTVSVNKVKTQLGTVKIKQGIRMTQANNNFFFDTGNSNDNLIVQNFDLGTFIDNQQLGIVDGNIKLKGIAGNKFELKDIFGNINRFDFNNYSYQNIRIKNGAFKDNIVDAKVNINDPNVEMEFDGSINLNDDLAFTFQSEITNASLQELGFASENMNVCANLDIDLSGNNLDNLQGTGKLTDVSFFFRENEILLPQGNLDIQRGEKEDKFSFQSSLADISIDGKVDFEHLWKDLNYQFSQIIPTLYSEKPEAHQGERPYSFAYNIRLKSVNDVLKVFNPNITLADNTTIQGNYSKENLTLNTNSNWLKIKNIELKNINIENTVKNNTWKTNYAINRLKVSDSLYFDDVSFVSDVKNSLLKSELKWDETTDYPSKIKWNTKIDDFDTYSFELSPSFFSLNRNRWEIVNASKIALDSTTATVSNFKLQREKQSILINGQLSESDEHRLNYEVNNLEIGEITRIFMKELAIEGQFNAWGFLSNPTKNIDYLTDGHIVGLNINHYDIGDVFIQSQWDNLTESIEATGSLDRNTLETIQFDGNFYPDRTENSLDVDIDFNQTDISFANSFVPETVLNEIKGALNGSVVITGKPTAPKINGDIDLQNISTNVEILDAAFKIDGTLNITEDAFSLYCPVYDEENNSGKIDISIFHQNFKDMSINAYLNLKEDAFKKVPVTLYGITFYQPAPLDRFLVMNSKNEVGRAFYGKAYVTGDVNVFGSADNLEITVNTKTEKGTTANIPIFGTTVVSTEDDLIKWVNEGDTLSPENEKLDLTGVTLDINLEATKDALVRVVLDESVGNVLEARGDGNINMGVNQYGELTLNGAYTVDNGQYEFVMGPVRQKFFIDEGGTISWTGSPYDAMLNLSAYHIVNANLGELTPENSKVFSSHEQVYCYLDISNTLMSPEIKFNLKAPNTNEAGRTQLQNVTSNQDELNRQFFSLLLWKSFQPLNGQSLAGTNAAIDLATNQINSLLAQMSPDYKLNVNIDSDQLTGDNTFALGVKKEFLDDRLIISGSFGVENQSNSSQSSNSFIGDVNIEYLINEEGTFRINAFNESNDQSVIYNQQKGPFTQGLGLKYREDFNSVQDFRLIQKFLDIFRKNKRYKKKRKKHQVALPPKNARKEE